MYKNVGIIKFHAQSNNIEIFTSENYWMFQFKCKNFDEADLNNVIDRYEDKIPFQIYKEKNKSFCLICEGYDIKAYKTSTPFTIEQFCEVMQSILDSIRQEDLCEEINNNLLFRANGKLTYINFPYYMLHKQNLFPSIRALKNFLHEKNSQRNIKYKPFISKLLRCESLREMKEQLNYFKKIYLVSANSKKKKSIQIPRESLCSRNSFDSVTTVRKSHRKYKLFKDINSNSSYKTSLQNSTVKLKRTNEFGLSKEKSKGFYSTSGFKGKKCQYVNSNMQTFTSTKSSFISSRRKGKKEERKERKKTKLKLTDDSFKLSESSCFESESKSEWMKGIVNKSLLKWQERKQEENKNEKIVLKKQKPKKESIINQSFTLIKNEFENMLEEEKLENKKNQDLIKLEEKVLESQEKEKEKEVEKEIDDSPFTKLTISLIEENKRILQKYNYIGECVINTNKWLQGCKDEKIFWQLPSFFLYKQFYSLRMNVLQKMENQYNQIKSEQFQEFIDIIKEQNEAMQDSLTKLLKIALKKTKKYISSDRQNITRMMNLDFSNMFQRQVSHIIFNYVKTLQQLKQAYPTLILHLIELCDAFLICRKKQFNVEERKRIEMEIGNGKTESYYKNRMNVLIRMIRNSKE